MGYCGPLDKLAFVQAKRDILNCNYRYCRGLDRHDYDLILSAFHPDGINCHAGFPAPIDEFVEWAKDLHKRLNFSGHTHNITSQNLVIDGDMAQAESLLIYFNQTSKGRLVSGSERYIDTYQRRNDVWKIRLRRLAVDISFALDASMSGDGAPLAGQRSGDDALYSTLQMARASSGSTQ